MAGRDVVGRATWETEVDPAGVKKGLDDVTRQIKGAGTEAERAFGKQATGALSKFGTVIGITAIAITGLFVGSVKAAAEWQTAFAGVRKTLDVTGLSAEEAEKVFGKLEDEIRAMAKVIPIPVEELAHLAEAAGALGVKTEDVSEFVRVTALIGATTDVSADQAATALGKIGNLVKLTAEDYDNFGATLVQLGNTGASFESEIIDMAKRIAGVSASAGIATDQMLGWASAIANTGLEADAGGSAFQEFVKKIQTNVALGGAQLDNLAEAAGLTEEAFKELTRTDMSEAIRRIVEGLSKVNGEARTIAISEMGMGDIRKSRLLDGLANDLGNVNDSLLQGRRGWQENAALTTEAAKKFATFDSKLKLAGAALNDVGITVGTVLLPPLTELATMVADIASGMGDWLDVNPELVSTMTPLLAVLSGIIALKFGAKMLTSLLPIPGAGGILARGFSKAIGDMTGNAEFTLSGTKAGTALGKAFSLAFQAAAILGIAIVGTTIIRELGINARKMIDDAFGTEFHLQDMAGPIREEMEAMAKAFGVGFADVAAVLQAEQDKTGQNFVEAWTTVRILSTAAGKLTGSATVEAVVAGANDALGRENLSDLDWGIADMPDKARAAGTAMGASLADAYKAQLAVLARSRDIGLEQQWDLAVTFARNNAELVKEQWASLPGIMQDAALAIGMVTEDWIAAHDELARSATSLGGYMTIGMAEALQAVQSQVPVIAELMGQLPKIGTGAGKGLATGLVPPILRGVAAATIAMGGLEGGLREQLKGARDEVTSSMKDLRWAIANPQAWTKTIRMVEDAIDDLNRRIAAAQRRGDTRTVALLTGQKGHMVGIWQDTAKQGYVEGERITRRHGDGVARDRHRPGRIVRNIVDDERRPMTTLVGQAHGYGASTIAEYTAGLASGRAAAIAQGAGIVKAVGNIFRASSPPTSPLNPMRDIMKWGRSTVEAYGAGMREGIPALASVLGGLGGPRFAGFSMTASTSQTVHHEFGGTVRVALAGSTVRDMRDAGYSGADIGAAAAAVGGADGFLRNLRREYALPVEAR